MSRPNSGPLKRLRTMPTTKKWLTAVALLAALLAPLAMAHAQHSVARQWNDALLDAIRVDYARPTVHSRNLFHASVAMYDAWAAYDATAETYLLGQSVSGFFCSFSGVPTPSNVAAARDDHGVVRGSEKLDGLLDCCRRLELELG